MSGFFLLYLVATFVTAAIMLFLAVYAWRRRDTAGAAAFAGMMLALTVWLVTNGLRDLRVSGIPMFWFRSSFLGIAPTPVFFFIFALQHNGLDRRLTRGRTAALFAAPLLTQVFNWVPPLQPLFLVEPHPLPQADLQWMEAVTRGPWFWVHTSVPIVQARVKTHLLLKLAREKLQQEQALSERLLLNICSKINRTRSTCGRSGRFEVVYLGSIHGWGNLCTQFSAACSSFACGSPMCRWAPCAS